MLDKKLWYEIEDAIGTVSDLKIAPHEPLSERDTNTIELHTKQNGVEKVDYLDAKTLIHCLYYSAREWSPKASIAEPSF